MAKRKKKKKDVERKRDRERVWCRAHLKAKSVLFLPEAEMGDLLIPEFIWLHHTD